MNIIRFREAVKEAGNGKGPIVTSQVSEILSAPVFLCGDIEQLNDEELEWCEQHILDEGKRYPRHLPFPLFSAIYSLPAYENEGITDNAIIICGKPSPLAGSESKVQLICTMKADGHLGWLSFYFMGRKDHGLAFDVYLDGRRITATMSQRADSAKNYTEIASGFRNTMLKIIFDIMNPANVILRVTPKVEGKSVEWVKAREHYCIINKTHAARCLRDGRGPTETEIQRSAHWRRAHMRRLMSDKFTHKKGQLVFVKQSWVGPEEWEGTDRKLYKVIHTTPPSPITHHASLPCTPRTSNPPNRSAA